jgi:poly-gamma-glutamate synthesis protein (capsule biosynthesis protein)
MLTRRGLLTLPLILAPPFARRGAPEPPRVPLPRTRLVFGGDVMLCRFVGRLAREKKDPAWPFRELAPFFAGADIAFANLESPFSDRGHPAEHGMVFKAAPEMIEGLRLAGIKVVSTANNHARDCGEYGVKFTLDWLASHGISAAGTGATPEAAHKGVVLERNGTRFGFLGYTFDQANGNYKTQDDCVAVADVEKMRADVGDLKRRSDVIIVSMHAGNEYQPKPNAMQIRFARAAIDAGARVVAGHHPHVVQPVEHYGGGVIFYSLGNLVFDQFQRKETQIGRVVELIFLGRRIERVEICRVDIVLAAPRVTGEPAAV